MGARLRSIGSRPPPDLPVVPEEREMSLARPGARIVARLIPMRLQVLGSCPLSVLLRVPVATAPQKPDEHADDDQEHDQSEATGYTFHGFLHCLF